MPMNNPNRAFGHSWMEKITDEAANFENIIEFGSGCVAEVDRRYVEELKNTIADKSIAPSIALRDRYPAAGLVTI